MKVRKKNIIIKNKNVRKFNNKYKKLIIIFILCFFVCCLLQNKFYTKHEMTLVSALFRVETPRHKFDDYFLWVTNLLQINKPIIFFVDKNISKILKKIRPKQYKKKTIWIELDITDLFFYRHYKKELEKTYIIDKAKYKHNVILFIIWNEKIMFVKKSIKKNYFNSKYFFWVDAGYFREKSMTKYIKNWPSIEKFKTDPRVMLNEIRKINKQEFNKLINFDQLTHDKFMNDYNIGGAFYGGRSDYLLKFCYLYIDVFRLFKKNNKFVGSEQNLYTIVAYLHPEITNIIHSGDFFFMKSYLLENNHYLVY